MRMARRPQVPEPSRVKEPTVEQMEQFIDAVNRAEKATESLTKATANLSKTVVMLQTENRRNRR